MPPRCIPFSVALSDTDEGRGIELQRNQGHSVATGAKNTVGADTVIEGESDGVRVKSTKYYSESIR